VAALLCTALGESPAPPTLTLARRLCDRYRQLKTVACTVRKITAPPEGEPVRMLSRVTYRNPDCVHVDITSPASRRIVADGRRLYYYEQGARRGFSRPVDELSETWTAALRNIPATPMEHLLRLRNCAETVLPATREFPLRCAYDASPLTVVLCCDARERPLRIEFFRSPAMKDSVARYDYDDFLEADGCWLARVSKAVMTLPDGRRVHETRRIDNLRVNQPVEDSIFAVERFFEGVEFTNDFKMTYMPPKHDKR